MNNLKYIFSALAISMTLLSCGGGNDLPEPDPTPTPGTKGKKFEQTCDMPAQASEKVIALRGLSAEVSRFTNPPSWMSITRQTYVSGTPEVEVSTRENLETEARQHEITFYAGQDTLVLTVHQEAYDTSGDSNLEQPYNTTTDKPAYMPRKRTTSHR